MDPERNRRYRNIDGFRHPHPPSIVLDNVRSSHAHPSQSPPAPRQSTQVKKRKLAFKKPRWLQKKFISKHLLLISSLGLTLLLGVAVFQKNISEAVEHKASNQAAEFVELQSMVANLPDATSIQRGQSADGPYVLRRYQDTALELLEKSKVSPNIVEWVFAPNNATKLKREASRYKSPTEQAALGMANLSEQLKATLKFIEYNPRQDLVNFGKDKTLDDEQIEVTKQGLLDIKKQIDNTGAGTPGTATSKRDISFQIQNALSALENFKNTKNLSSYTSSISEAQNISLNTIQRQLAEIKNTYKTAYQ